MKVKPFDSADRWPRSWQALSDSADARPEREHSPARVKGPFNKPCNTRVPYLTVTVTGLNCRLIAPPSGVLATPLTWMIEPP